jgi:hypothetical protein
MIGFYEYGKQSYGYVKGEDFLSGCVNVRRIVFHEVCFCYSTIITFVAWRELLCLLFIGFLTLSCPLWEACGHFNFSMLASTKPLPLPCTHLLPHYDLVLSVMYLWFMFVAVCSRSMHVATTDCKSFIFSHNKNTFSQFFKVNL